VQELARGGYRSVRHAQSWDVRGTLKRAEASDDTPAMRAPWKHLVLERLVSSENPQGGFGYRPSASPSPEPTSLGCIALLSHGQKASTVEKSLNLLCKWQNDSGAVPVSRETPTATWPTAIAVLAWRERARRGSDAYDDNILKALDYMLATEGKTFTSDPRIYGHDTQLIGWPWIEETHTWLEPTSYALLSLRATGKLDHPRYQEALRAIYDRAIPSGGWNYGNARMFGNDLRSFPSTTGIVLAALAGRERDETVVRAIQYLHTVLPGVRSPFSLAWGVIGLRCWDALPSDATIWMQSAMTQERPAPPSPLEDALMLIAVAETPPFGARGEKALAFSGAGGARDG